MLPESFLFKLLDVMSIGLTYIDENGKVVFANNEASEILDIDRDSMIGNSVLACHPRELYSAVEQKIGMLRKSPGGEWHRIIERNGRFIENYYSSVFLDQSYKGIVIATKDVTQRETLARELRKSLDEMAVLFEAAQLVNSTLNVRDVMHSIVGLAQKMVGFDAGGILLYDRVSRDLLYHEIYNYSSDEIAGLRRCQPFQELLSSLEQDFIVKPVEDHFTCSLRSRIEMAVPMVVNSEISGIWFVENHRDDRFPPDRCKLLVTLANLTSSAIKNAWMYERIMFKATTDEQTGLYNRRYFEHLLALEKEKARLMRTPLSLIMADVNRLKYINDTFGHEVGDYVIAEAAAILKNSVRKGELIFRYGGDEMVVLLPGANRRQTSDVVRRIRTNVRKWNRANRDKNVFLHMSVGCYTAQDAQSLDNLVRLADEDMYRDKEEYYKSTGLPRQTETAGPR